MPWIGFVVSSFAALALVTGAAAAPTYCDPELLSFAKSGDSYQLRGDRCEGVYAQQVSSLTVDLRSFVKSFSTFDPQTQSELNLTWEAPSRSPRTARLRATSLKPRTHFRMDTAQPASAGLYRWPTAVLAGQRLGRDDLGILAWIELVGIAGSTREVYLPLRAGAPEVVDGYEVTVVPSIRLKKVLLTVLRLDGETDKVIETVVADKDVGGEFAYYPASQPTVIATGAIGPPGYYRIQIKALAAAGDPAIKEIDFYHSGD